MKVELEMQKIVGERMRTKREELGLTRKELAKRAKCGESSIDSWEHGRREVLSLEARENLAQALGMEYGDLFWRDLPDRKILMQTMRDMIPGMRVHYLCAVRGIKVREVAKITGLNKATLLSRVFVMESVEFFNDAGRWRTLEAICKVIGISKIELVRLVTGIEEEDRVQTVAQRICQRRLELGFSRQMLADKMGVARQTVSGWENGKYMVSDELRQKLADALKTEYGELFWRELPNRRHRYILMASMTLGERILFVRELQWMSRKELAVRSGVTVHTIITYDDVHRTKASSKPTVQLIATALGVGVKELCG